MVGRLEPCGDVLLDGVAIRSHITFRHAVSHELLLQIRPVALDVQDGAILLAELDLAVQVVQLGADIIKHCGTGL